MEITNLDKLQFILKIYLAPESTTNMSRRNLYIIESLLESEHVETFRSEGIKYVKLTVRGETIVEDALVAL